MNSSPADRPFDTGLQVERTALSWQRTALALSVGCLLGARIVSRELDTTTLAIALGGTVLAAGLYAAARVRYQRRHRLLSEHGDRTPLGGAGLLALTAAIPVVLAVLGGWFVLTH